MRQACKDLTRRIFPQIPLSPFLFDVSKIYDMNYGFGYDTERSP